MEFKSKPGVRKTSIKKIVTIIAIIIAIFASMALVGLLMFNRWYSDNLKPLNSSSTDTKSVTIESGISAKEIGVKLENEDIIKNSRAFDLYVNRQGMRSKLQAGTYKLSASQSVQRITEMLVNGEVDTSYITILPGKRLDEIKKAFIAAGFDEQSVVEALDPGQYRQSHTCLKDLPEGASLEGYIYPESIKITAESSPKQVIEVSLSELDGLLNDELVEKLEVRNLNFHQAFTLASIIEKEVKNQDNDRNIVSQIFQKRLAENMVLGSDVTFIYAATLLGIEPSVDIDSPYNTRKVDGLPPGPISNFSASSLLAIAEPAETDYLYFLAGDDEKIYYGKTYQEHQSNIENHCQKNCQAFSE